MTVSAGKVRVGSRDSGLAVAQARLVMDAIKSGHPEIELELVTLKTTGDKILDRSLDRIGGKGLFVKELDEALRNGEVDICVHSYKDMPTPDNPLLPVVAVMAREDPRDVLLLPAGATEIDMTAPVGTSSPRRRLQLARLFPDWECATVRGNVHTRLAKLDDGQFGGLVLAAAGIRRLGLWDRVFRAFSVAEMIPAPCQGVLAIQGRAGGEYAYLNGISDSQTFLASRAERGFVEALDGGCSAPTAAHAELRDGKLHITGWYADADGHTHAGVFSGSPLEAERIGYNLALQLAVGNL